MSKVSKYVKQEAQVVQRIGHLKVKLSSKRLRSERYPDTMSRSCNDTSGQFAPKSSRATARLLEPPSVVIPRTLQSTQKRSKLVGHTQVKRKKGKPNVKNSSKRLRSERNPDKMPRSCKDTSRQYKLKPPRAVVSLAQLPSAKTMQSKQKRSKLVGGIKLKRAKGKKTTALSRSGDKLPATQRSSEKLKVFPVVKVEKKRPPDTQTSGTHARASGLKHIVESIKRTKTSHKTKCHKSRHGNPSLTKYRVSTDETSSRKSTEAIRNSKITKVKPKTAQFKLHQDKPAPSPPQKSATIERPFSVSNGKTPRTIKIKSRNGVSSAKSSHSSPSSTNKKNEMHMISKTSGSHEAKRLRGQQNQSIRRKTSSLPPMISPCILSSTINLESCENFKIKIKLQNTETEQNSAVRRADRIAKTIVDAALPNTDCNSEKDEVQMDSMDDILQASNNLFSTHPADESHLFACCDECLVLQGKSFKNMFFVQCASCNMRYHSECVGETCSTWQKHWPEGFICPECSWLHCFGEKDIIQGNNVECIHEYTYKNGLCRSGVGFRHTKKIMMRRQQIYLFTCVPQPEHFAQWNYWMQIALQNIASN